MCPQHLSEKSERRPHWLRVWFWVGGGGGGETWPPSLDLEDGGVGAAKLLLAV